MVKNDSKNRYSLEIINNKLKVRANQGHSINVDLDLESVLSAKNYPNAIHGTNRLAWNNISKSGISRMNRKHIHFAIGEPGDKKVTSGMPPRSDIMIFLNLTLALQNGIKLFKSKNDVILSEGDEEGYIRPKYFLKVIDRNTRQDLI
ncbi:tRNA 2'-phosphotransferase 1-like [Argonauta hians]